MIPTNAKIRKSWPVAVAALCVLALLGCDDDESVVSQPTPGAEDLVWSLDGLEPLGDGSVYEAWLIVSGAPVSVGRFDIAANGVPELTGADLTPAMEAGAEAFVLTIEPETGDDPAPSQTKVLGGALQGGVALLSVAHPAAFGQDFSSADASFILQTPTTAAVADDYDQGIWWLDLAAGPGASANLPTLPAGWAYEGWVVKGGTPVSTGRFTDPGGPDSDGPGPTAGPDGAPPFPGQDFITPPVDLVGAASVISVEPEPDDSPLPFALKPLVDGTVEDVGPGVLQSMTNQSATNNPTGRAELR